MAERTHPCIIDDCTNTITGGGLICGTHRWRMKHKGSYDCPPRPSKKPDVLCIECGRLPQRSKQLCTTCLSKYRREDRRQFTCVVEGCNSPQGAIRNMCGRHYKATRWFPPCSETECDQIASGGKGLCAKHYSRAFARESRRGWQLQKLYGISADQYDAMNRAQAGLCCICREPEIDSDHRTGTVRSLAVDHDHISGIIRGLLCRRCNQGIGLFLDSPELMRRAAEYLGADLNDTQSPL